MRMTPQMCGVKFNGNHIVAVKSAGDNHLVVSENTKVKIRLCENVSLRELVIQIVLMGKQNSP